MGKTGENNSEVINVKGKSLFSEKTFDRFTYSMKKRLTSAAALALVMVVLALGWYFRDRTRAPQPVPETASIASTDEPFQFLLKAKKQSLELFHVQNGGWRKLAEFPITLSDLPESDRQLLRTGLALRDAGELQRSLEDYLPNS